MFTFTRIIGATVFTYCKKNSRVIADFPALVTFLYLMNPYVYATIKYMTWLMNAITIPKATL